MKTSTIIHAARAGMVAAYISSQSSGSDFSMSQPTSQAGLTAAASITQALATGYS